jgi:hypothetical protein
VAGTGSDPVGGGFAARVLFDNGTARVETHPIYGAIIRGAVRSEMVFGGPAFVPADPADEAEIVIPDDLGGLT